MTLDIAIHHAFPAATLNVAFTAPAGVTALFGPSGAGKSSVANAVAGLLRPDKGHVILNGRTLFDAATWVPPHLRRIGYVFQDPRLFPHKTVRANLLYGATDSKGLDGIVDLLDIAPLLDRRPSRLSGGERQRVAIGRALLSSPRLLVMDEPLSALDSDRKAEILPYLERLARETSIPILYVSHALSEVIRLADQMALMAKGRLVGFGPPADVLSDPQSAIHLGARQAGTVIEGRVSAIEHDGLVRIETGSGPLLLAAQASTGARLRIRIMAEDVLLSRGTLEGLSALNSFPVHIRMIRPDGPMALLQLELDDGTRLLARITQRSVAGLELVPGMRVHAVIKSAALIDQS